MEMSMWIKGKRYGKGTIDSPDGATYEEDWENYKQLST